MLVWEIMLVLRALYSYDVYAPSFKKLFCSQKKLTSLKRVSAKTSTLIQIRDNSTILHVKLEHEASRLLPSKKETK